MKALPTALTAHYALGSTTLATCWRVTLTNGTVLCFTTHDQTLTIDGETYEANAAVSPSAVRQQTRLAVDNIELTGILDSERISSQDLLAGLWDFAQVEVFQVNFRDLTQGKDVLVYGRLGEISQQRNTFLAELRGLNNAYSQSIGQMYQPGCRATLGDARCGVDVAALTVTGTLASVSADGMVLSDPARTEPGPSGGKAITGITKSTDSGYVTTITCSAHGFALGQVVRFSGIGGMTELNGRSYVIRSVATNSFTIHENSYGYANYTSGGLATPQGDVGTFDGGLITMTSGASAGYSMEIRSYLPGVLTLAMQLPYGAAAGDTYSLKPGCGKRFVEDCVGRFNNGINFRGEPHLPGMDKALRVGGSQ